LTVEDEELLEELNKWSIVNFKEDLNIIGKLD